jgi:carboxyl-terminal processing protease
MFFVTAAILVAVLTLGLRASSDDDVFFAIKKNLTIFGSMYEELSVGYVDPIEPERLIRTGMESMLETLDPYTVFIDEADNEEIDIATQGRYAGVGISIGRHQGRITVVAPVEGYSAFRQGVRAGDVITHIDGASVDDLTPVDVSTLLRGDAGTTVEIRIDREGERAPMDFLLTRSEVKVNNVSYSDFLSVEGDTKVGYIRLDRFGRESYDEVRRAVQNLQEQSEIDALLLDLRDNPGGLLEAAVEVSGLFLPVGTEIVFTRGRLPQTQKSYRTQQRPLLDDVRLAVLVNGSSASASEIVAGAVQDLDRGVVVGERTFGKGLVQIVRPLPYNTSLKLTISKYFTPAGRSIQAVRYTHQIEEGLAIEIPDSLQQRFRTKSGREVRSSGGIEPDLSVPLEPRSDLMAALLRKSSFFLFANRFASQHTGITADFEVDDEVLAEFSEYLDGTGFTYRTRAEDTVDELEENLLDAGYEDLRSDLQALRLRLEDEKGADFQRQAAAITRELREQILARYLGPTDQIKATLGTDPQVEAAVSVLVDENQYRALLKP